MSHDIQAGAESQVGASPLAVPSRAASWARWVHTAIIVLLWLAAAAVLLNAWQSGKLDTGRRGAGWTGGQALRFGLIATSVETAIFCLLTQPWLRRPPKWLIVLPIFGVVAGCAWTVISLILIMEAGGVFVYHAAWMVLLTLAMVVEIAIMAVRAWTAAEHVEEGRK